MATPATRTRKPTAKEASASYASVASLTLTDCGSFSGTKACADRQELHASFVSWRGHLIAGFSVAPATADLLAATERYR
jgi:hypothetical protein